MEDLEAIEKGSNAMLKAMSSSFLVYILCILCVHGFVRAASAQERELNSEDFDSYIEYLEAKDKQFAEQIDGKSWICQPDLGAIYNQSLDRFQEIRPSELLHIRPLPKERQSMFEAFALYRAGSQREIASCEHRYAEWKGEDGFFLTCLSKGHLFSFSDPGMRYVYARLGA